MAQWHIAQMNIGLTIAPLDRPELADFVGALEGVNVLAEASPGFIWRLKSGSGKSPKTGDWIRANYHGTLIDGNIFESTIGEGGDVSRRGETIVEARPVFEEKLFGPSPGFGEGPATPYVFEKPEERHVAERQRSKTQAFLSDLRDLKIGDLIVHVDHGIGEFVGLKQLGVRGGEGASEFLELRYHGDDKLFVPVERLDLIQKYTGGARPALDRLGGTTWEKAKTRVKKAMRDMAEELLKLYAARKAVAGHAFSPDSHWQQEFEDAFEYDLTPKTPLKLKYRVWAQALGFEAAKAAVTLNASQRRNLTLEEIKDAERRFRPIVRRAGRPS